jgi:hypothetical protein
MNSRLNAIGRMEDFFNRIDSNRLFNSTDPAWYYQFRTRLKAALVQALVWQRPELEVSKGIQWPYEALKERVFLFEELAGSRDPFVRRQAMLFLALLPFPGQWSWLKKIQANLSDETEVIAFLKLEQETIQSKIAKKSHKKFKLKNFCQILKKPRLPFEKGVLRIFSIPYFFFAIPELLQELGKYYMLYIEPAAGVVFRHTWMRIFSTLEDPTLFGVSSHEDAAFLKSQPGVFITRLAHGDYLATDIEVSHEREKSVDIVFNATFDEMDRKRHFFMLELMDHPLLKNTTALFLGRGDEINVDKFKQEVRRKRLDERTAVLANIMRKDVPKQLDRCRIGVHLALHENGCRCIYEFYRSDLPCVISSSMGGINMDIINPKTGIASTDRDLPKAILEALNNRDGFSPRNWFLENSGIFHSTRKLNSQLKAQFKEWKYNWQDDIVPLTSSGESRYVSNSHYRQFRSEFCWLFDLFNRQTDLPINISED